MDVHLALEPIALRWPFDILKGIARDQLGVDPKAGALSVFLGRRRDSMKALFDDGSGYVPVTRGHRAGRTDRQHG